MTSISDGSRMGRSRRPLAFVGAVGLAAVMVIGMLPGAVLAVGANPLIVTQSDTSAVTTSPAAGTITGLVAGTTVTLTPSVTGVLAPTVLGNTSFTIVTAAQITVGSTIYASGSVVPFATCSAVGVCTASVAWTSPAATTAASYTITVIDATDASSNNTVVYTATVIPAATTKLAVTGFTNGTLNTAVPPVYVDATGAVTAFDAYGNLTPGYTGTVFFSSSDPSAVLPASVALSAGKLTGVSVTFETAGTQWVTAESTNYQLTGTQSGIVISPSAAAAINATFMPLTPAVRVLDTRYAVGHSGALSAGVPMTFQVAGATTDATIPSDAVAVTGNLTVAAPGNGWAVYLGPSPVASPTSSTVNFVAGQTASNGVTVALSSTGTLSATFMSTTGSTTGLVFDVTGYFLNDDSGSYYNVVSPVRAIDTRISVGTITPSVVARSLVANQPMCFDLSGTIGDSSATAVTGNLTVANASSGWAIYLGPAAVAAPTTSTLNFTAGQTLANGVTVALGANEKMCATFISTTGTTTDIVFDVTGYYSPEGDYMYTPIAPVRMVDSRIGLGVASALVANAPREFQVASTASPLVKTAVAVGATAITGNLTITDQTFGWAAYLGPNALTSPTTSTINFSAGQVIANNVTVPLGGSNNADLFATFISTSGKTTSVVLDVTGYFHS